MAPWETDLITNAACFLLGIVVTTLLVVKVFRESDLDTIPTVGSNSWLGSWWAGSKFHANGVDVIREGYAKYKHRPFKVADRYRWLVIVSSRDHREELANAPEDQLSFPEATRARMSTDYTLGREVQVNTYHVPIILSQLTRNIAALASDIRDEIVTAFDETLGLKNDEWKSVPALNAIQKIAFRTSNRVFVGLPLCRNPEWMDFNMKNGDNIINGAVFLQRFPEFLTPFVAHFIKNFDQSLEDAMEFLAPIIEERQTCFEKYGDKWVDRPNDLLSWMMEVAVGEERTAKLLTARILSSNFASIHTTSQSFTHALIFLAVNPQYIQPLRDEIEAMVGQEGWSKAAIDKMHKVDSFLKENQRLKGTASETLARRAVKDFRFSDGTFIPKGTLISSPTGCLHLDDEIYEDSTLFDPFRFSKMREVVGEETKHQFASTSLEYLPFGHGRRACPGRFFVAYMMKTMLAHIVLSYDVKLEEKALPPESLHLIASITVDPNVEIMFRKRRC